MCKYGFIPKGYAELTTTASPIELIVRNNKENQKYRRGCLM